MNTLTKKIPKKPDIPEEIQARWQRIVDIMARLADVRAGLIMRVDPPQIEVLLSSATEENPYRKGERADLDTGLYCETVMKRRTSLLVPNAVEDPEWDHNPDIKLGMTFYLGYPLTWPDGEIFGTICILDKRDNLHADQFQDLISEFQQVVEMDLRLIIESREHKDLLAEVQRHRDHLEEIVTKQVSELERQKTNLEEKVRFENLILDIYSNFIDISPHFVHDQIALTLKRICESLGEDNCAFFEVFADQRRIESVCIFHKEEAYKDPCKIITASGHPWAYHQLVEEKKPVVFTTVADLPPEAGVDRAQWEQEGIQSIFMFPLSIGKQVTYLMGFWSYLCSQEHSSANICCLRFVGEILVKVLNHMRTEEALLKSERRLNDGQRIAHLGSWELNISTQKLILSDEGYRILGLLPHGFELTFKATLAFVHPDDRQAVQQALKESMSDPDKAYSLEHRVVRPDGTERFVHGQGVVILDQDRKPISMIGTILDITERKHMERELENAFAEIKKLKENLEIENIYLREEMEKDKEFNDLIGDSDSIKYVIYRIRRIAETKTTVLLTGETGTGKGQFARIIHKMSKQKGKPFVHVNCAGLPANLIESELFGREKGAFTGSTAKQIGRFELANGGTIFLDEIGELPTELQAKLLKVIEDGEFEHLGSPHSIKVNVRIIASTNRDLEEDIKKGRFRRDLFFRLNIFPITIPPLRHRKKDIPPLVRFYVKRFSMTHGKNIKKISPNTMKALENYTWPGNVRELMNVIERAVILSDGPNLRLAERIDAIPSARWKDMAKFEEKTAAKSLFDMEREHILRVLQETGWKIEGAGGGAQTLQMNPSTLRARMKKLGIKKPRGYSIPSKKN